MNDQPFSQSEVDDAAAIESRILAQNIDVLLSEKEALQRQNNHLQQRVIALRAELTRLENKDKPPVPPKAKKAAKKAVAKKPAPKP
jgi:cell division protein FtsB